MAVRLCASKVIEMRKQVSKQLGALQVGDLVRVEWFDASIGKSLGGGSIDIPVVSWGVFLGIMGKRNKHIVLAQNNFCYADGFYDIDYTAIPLSWATKVQLMVSEVLSREEGDELARSFVLGQRRSRRFQRKVTNHE